ncbi:hypothetical protein A2V71_00190 [Candidatus Berkelbacteria bacterium RBG_13_40_8]|uniref:Uncharacterized protein n=1 Tax=Candidatus Berkelbacteria bacterium RBG_13_40_8 TaxID=1797467 RepID=A0A1F5DN80_9BACT|nr:MAG: hypothetical protein A2V71_00190 [Candidatus Berkelbacteria bacterium RBG_13_40_8]
MKTERLITFIIAAIIISAVVFIATHFVLDSILNRPITSVSGQNLQKAYAQEIAESTDVNKLTQDGAKLAKGNQVEAALMNLKRATELEPKNRDAWVFLGYAQLKNNEPEEALKSLQTAEKLDPINPTTYQYLVVAYQQTGDADGAKKAKEKYDYLTKSDKKQ